MAVWAPIRDVAMYEVTGNVPPGYGTNLMNCTCPVHVQDIAAAYTLLGYLYEQQGRGGEALAVYREGLENKAIGMQEYRMLEARAGQQ